MRLGRAGLDAVILEEGLAHEVRRLAAHGADADVVARLAEVDRQELGVAVGVVQQAHVAEGRQLVEGARALARLGAAGGLLLVGARLAAG